MNKNTTRLFYYLAVTLLVISCIFHILTFIPSLRTSGNSLILILGIGVFPTFAAAIKATKRLTIESDVKNLWNNILKGTPKKLKKMLWFVFAYVFFNFFFSLFVLNKGGLSPEIVDGKYVLENKGKVVEEITEEQYFEHKAYFYRGMSGHFILFQFFSVAMLISAINTNDEKTRHNIV